MGLIYGDYGGRSDEFAPGGFSFENGFCPHGGMSLLPPLLSLVLLLRGVLNGSSSFSLVRRVQEGYGGRTPTHEGS